MVPFKDVPHSYWNLPARDPFTLFLSTSPAIARTPISSARQLQSLLEVLHIPASSQLLVYSATSLQSGLIHPTNPRALYFNEEVYVGYVPGGRVEIAAIDPELGPIFYVSSPESASTPFVRSQRCMNCHAGRTSQQLPGMVAESVICTETGASLDGFRRETVGHQVPLALRFGGWHVTGSQERGIHLGNLTGEAAPGGYRKLVNPPGSQFSWAPYPVQSSDLLPHLIHEHQLGFHNLVTLATYRTREALAAGQGNIRPVDASSLDVIAHQLVRYLLFADEAALPHGGFTPLQTYAEDFLARRIPNRAGKSLRDLDLHSRLFRYRCSYMIYSTGFQSLPHPMKSRVSKTLVRELGGTNSSDEFSYLPNSEKSDILAILTETGAL